MKPTMNTSVMKRSSILEQSAQFMQLLLGAVQFVSEGAMEIFSNTDNYPAVGFQPYDGEVSAQWVES